MILLELFISRWSHVMGRCSELMPFWSQAPAKKNLAGKDNPGGILSEKRIWVEEHCWPKRSGMWYKKLRENSGLVWEKVVPVFQVLPPVERLKWTDKRDSAFPHREEATSYKVNSLNGIYTNSNCVQLDATANMIWTEASIPWLCLHWKQVALK